MSKHYLVAFKVYASIDVEANDELEAELKFNNLKKEDYINAVTDSINYNGLDNDTIYSINKNDGYEEEEKENNI